MQIEFQGRILETVNDVPMSFWAISYAPGWKAYVADGQVIYLSEDGRRWARVDEMTGRVVSGTERPS